MGFHYSTTNFDMKLFSDASLLGFSAIFGTQWFCSVWQSQLPAISDGDLSLAFRELYPIVAAAIVWGLHWKTNVSYSFVTISQQFIKSRRSIPMSCYYEANENSNMDSCHQ